MKYTLLLIILFCVQVFTQDKYFIYFVDKGIKNSSVLNKNSHSYNLAVKELSPKSLERRLKNMGNDFITFEDIPLNEKYISDVEKFGVTIIRKLKWFNAVSAYLAADQLENIKSLPFVKSIEPVKKIYFRDLGLDNTSQQLYKILDTNYNYGLSINQMTLSDVPNVHSKNINGSNVLIGILDSGFDWKRHNSLKDRNVIAEYDFIFDDSVTANQGGDALGQDSHGTYVFSVIAGFADSVLIGPAFNSSYILAKTEDTRSETHIEEDNYAAALIWMESYGVDITTSSLGYNIFDSGYSYTYGDMNGRTTIVTKAVELAFARGVSTFTSAGNEGNVPWKYIIAPADGFNIIAVGAVDEFGNLANFSSRGPTSDGRIKPEVVAQGLNTYGAVAGTNNGYRFASGTSAAAPIASGIAGLLLSAHPHLKNTQIRNIILETSSNSKNPNNLIGYGIISAKNAIEFPNLEIRNNTFLIHKIILENNINPGSVNIVFKIADDLLESFSMIKSGDYDYTYSLPVRSIGEIIEFNFTYADSQNNYYVFPETGYFKMVYGSELITLNLDIQSPKTNYEVSDFYPNPFMPAANKTTRIDFVSPGKELFKILLIDGTGQQVTQVSGITNGQMDYFEWNGYSDRGYLCASGVYYALIQVGSKQFGKKLILLK